MENIGMTFAELLMQIESPATEKPSFRIDDDRKAEWALRIIAADRAEAKRLNDTRRAMIDDYLAAIKAEDERCDKRCKYLEGLLEEYFQTVPHKETKTQSSYSLPSGKLIMKRKEPEIKVEPNAFCAWLEANGHDSFVETIKAPKWGEFKKNVELVYDAGTGMCIDRHTGELIEGVTAVARADTFMIKTGE